MSVIESQHQAHKARLKRMSARSVPQRETPVQSRVAAIAGIDLRAKRVPSRYMLDRDYERAWAIRDHGPAGRVAAPPAAHDGYPAGDRASLQRHR